MPESKTDQAHRSVEEIANYHDCGDARGREWLNHHPDAQPRAASALRALTSTDAESQDEAGSPPQQRLSATG